MKTHETKVHIGTSGFHYDHWKGPFYPEGYSQKDFLKFYRQYFHTVELNNTFYQLPRPSAVEHWRDSVDKGFIFAVKASRFITHIKKLHDVSDSLQLFYERIELFEDKIGPLLFQFPPSWQVNIERLRNFMPLLSKDYQYAFEFRNPTWFTQEVYDILAEHNAALCFYDSGGYRTPQVLTAELVYVRFHGPETMYQGKYPADQLAQWADHIRHWRRKVKAVYCYFNNDIKGFAPENGLTLIDMVSHKVHA